MDRPKSPRRRPPSAPFSITLLTLMVLIVGPLSLALLWVGWRSVDALEERNVEQRMKALDDAVTGFIVTGMRTITSVGLTLANGLSFSADAPASMNPERERQLVGALERQPNIAAAFVGYPDGLFLYAGRANNLPPALRSELGLPAGEEGERAIVVRRIDVAGAARQESWRLASAPEGSARTRPSDFDPRARPWYVEARRSGRPVLTEPYRFAFYGAPGISAGIPMQDGGVIGFDFTLERLADVIADYRITPGAIIALAVGSSGVTVETAACVDLPETKASDCPAGDAAAHVVLREAIAQAGASGTRIDRTVDAGGTRYRVIVNRLPPMLDRALTVGAAVPVDELNAASNTLIRRSAMMAGGAVAAAVVLCLLAALVLSRSMTRLADKTERFRQLDFSDTEPVVSRITEITRLSDSVERMREGLEVFGRYVSKSLVGQIMRAPQSAGVGGSRREVTVMFTDIEGFSRISEGLEPELLTSRLSRYFEALGSAVQANHGTIDKYIGDSVMAFWNAPETDPDHVANACRAALQAAAAGRALADKWRSRGRAAFRTRFGLHTGLAVVGNVGARDRINYTLVGAVANQASRLEGLNKLYGTEILASGEVVQATSGKFVWRSLDKVVPVGTTEVHEIFELLGAGDDRSHDAFLAEWQQGLTDYRSARFGEAIRHFTKALEVRSEDGPCAVMIGRCRELEHTGVPAGWDGVWHADRK